MIGKPVLSERARENVLFPDPASPVTRTRRPTATEALLTGVSLPHTAGRRRSIAGDAVSLATDDPPGIAGPVSRGLWTTAYRLPIPAHSWRRPTTGIAVRRRHELAGWRRTQIVDLVHSGGVLLAEGREAEVFLQPDGRVLKLWRLPDDGPKAEREHAVCRLLSPLTATVHTLTQVGDRPGLVMDLGLARIPTCHG